MTLSINEDSRECIFEDITDGTATYIFDDCTVMIIDEFSVTIVDGDKTEELLKQ